MRHRAFNPNTGVRRNVERHMIYFLVTDYGIAIIRVLHERMDAPHHL
jgi:toxin ParE1/3/4